MPIQSAWCRTESNSGSDFLWKAAHSGFRICFEKGISIRRVEHERCSGNRNAREWQHSHQQRECGSSSRNCRGLGMRMHGPRIRRVGWMPPATSPISSINSECWPTLCWKKLADRDSTPMMTAFDPQGSAGYVVRGSFLLTSLILWNGCWPRVRDAAETLPDRRMPELPRQLGERSRCRRRASRSCSRETH